jgi:hypothetical protein
VVIFHMLPPRKNFAQPVEGQRTHPCHVFPHAETGAAAGRPRRPIFPFPRRNLRLTLDNPVKPSYYFDNDNYYH